LSFFDFDLEANKNNPEEMEFEDLKIVPYDDGRRIRVFISISPFLISPIIEIDILDHDGAIVGSSTIVEPPFWKQEFTMHIQSSNNYGKTFSLTAKLIYPDLRIKQERSENFSFPFLSEDF